MYRNLRRLAAEGLLTERGDGPELRFDGNLDRHDHFTCLACGRIHDVPPRLEAPVLVHAAETAGFEVLSHRVELYGRCVACRRRASRSGRT